MILKKYAWLILIILFSDTLICKTVHQQVSALTKELVQGRQFIHSYTLIDGRAHESWTIDGQQVDKTTYDDAILTAEMAERRAERERAYALQQEEFAGQQRMQQAALKKLVKKGIDAAQRQLRTVEEYRLLPYMAYSNESLTQEQFEGISELIALGQAVIEDSEPAISELQAMLKRFERAEEGMKRLVRDSIEQAIAQCDDTEMLKKLLS